jgi:hypothetical protein
MKFFSSYPTHEARDEVMTWFGYENIERCRYVDHSNGYTDVYIPGDLAEIWDRWAQG